MCIYMCVFVCVCVYLHLKGWIAREQSSPNVYWSIKGCTYINAVASRVHKVCMTSIRPVCLAWLCWGSSLSSSSQAQFGGQHGLWSPSTVTLDFAILCWKCKEFYLGFFCARCPETVGLYIRIQNLVLWAYIASNSNMNLFRWEAGL